MLPPAAAQCDELVLYVHLASSLYGLGKKRERERERESAKWLHVGVTPKREGLHIAQPSPAAQMPFCRTILSLGCSEAAVMGAA